MWSAGERAQLAVWADGLLQQGESFGELVSLWLASHEAEFQGEPTRATALRKALATGLASSEVGKLQRHMQSLGDPVWALWDGPLLVALRVRPWPGEAMRARMDLVVRALKLPCTRYMRVLQFRPRGYTEQEALIERLAQPDIVGRARVLIVGESPANGMHRSTGCVDERCPWPDPADGLWAYFCGNEARTLPLPGGKSRARQLQIDAAAARCRARPGHADPRDLTLIARGLSDASPGVVRRATRMCAQLGADGAALLPLVVRWRQSYRNEVQLMSKAVSEYLACVRYDQSMEAIAKAFVPHIETSILCTNTGRTGYGASPRHLNLPASLSTQVEFRPVLKALIRAAERLHYSTDLVDINTANQASLMRLPGVGRLLALRIMARRLERSFTSVAELVELRGASPAMVKRLAVMAYAHVPRDRLDPNNASVNELCQGLGISQKLALSLVAARPLPQRRELLRVRGIGPVHYARLVQCFDWGD